MLFDLGVKVHSQLTTEEIINAIKIIDKQFDMVIISERIDESLILLKERLCWDFSDIVYLTKNSRLPTNKKEMTAEVIEKFRILNRGDVLLYQHFLAKHEQEVLRFGREKMDQQIEVLKTHINDFIVECNINITKVFAYDRVPKRGRTYKFEPMNNKNEDCNILTLDEQKIINNLRKMFMNGDHKL